MDEIGVSKFKATCLAALERVRASGRPLRVTRFGKPLADVVPSRAASRGSSWLGAMRGRGQIEGDLIAPAKDASSWNALEGTCCSIRTSGTVEVALASRALVSKHRDPADRFLVATAQIFDLTLVTADRQLYGIRGLRVLRNTGRTSSPVVRRRKESGAP